MQCNRSVHGYEESICFDVRLVMYVCMCQTECVNMFYCLLSSVKLIYDRQLHKRMTLGAVVNVSCVVEVSD